MKIGNWRFDEHADTTEVSADVDGYRLWYRVSKPYRISRTGDPFLAAALLPAMRQGVKLEIDPRVSVSAKLLRNVSLLQEIFHSWMPEELKIIPVSATTSPAEPINTGNSDRKKRPYPVGLTRGAPKAVLRLLEASLSTFLVLGRAALRLYEPEVPAQKIEALKRLAAQVPFDPDVFLTVQALKEGRLKARAVSAPALFAAYLDRVERIVAAVDQRVTTPAKGEQPS